MTSNGGQSTAPTSTRRGSKRKPRNGRTSAIRLRVYRPPDAKKPPPEAETSGVTDWGSIARIYDLEHPAARGPELRFWDELIKAHGGTALELAAGSGRVAIGLARKGHQVTGLELSEGMLERARGRTARLKPEVQERLTWVQGDMTDFGLGKQYGVVFVAYNSFWLLRTEALQEKCLANARRHVAPGGRLVLDLFPPLPDDYVGEEGITQYVAMAYKGQALIRVKDYTWNARTRLGTSDVRYYGEKRTTSPRRLLAQFRYSLRLVPLARVRALLTRCGFEVEAEYGTYEKEPLEPASPRAIFVCRVT
jgi:SAM-dependent methyltransferase